VGVATPTPCVLQAVPAALCTMVVGYAIHYGAGVLQYAINQYSSAPVGFAPPTPPHVSCKLSPLHYVPWLLDMLYTMALGYAINQYSSAPVGFAPPTPRVLQAVPAALCNMVVGYAIHYGSGVCDKPIQQRTCGLCIPHPTCPASCARCTMYQGCWIYNDVDFAMFDM
jgi:hypothetical protein